MKSSHSDPSLKKGPSTRSKERGVSFVDVSLAVALLAVLATLALPIARVSIRRAKEIELRGHLRAIRGAIDQYHDMAEAGLILQEDVSQEFFPLELEALVEGVEIANDPTGRTVKFLRRIPVDPMTGEAEWGMRSYQDDWDSTSWGGENVYDVFSLSEATGLDGKTTYGEW